MAVTRRQQELATELGRLRSLAGLSGRDMAKALGVNQATVSRIQHGTSRPSAGMTQTWLNTVRASDEDRRRVLDLLDAAHIETLPWATALGKAGHYQDQLRDLEQSATLIRNFQPTVIPGLLQTAEYIQHVLPLADRTGTQDHAAAMSTRLQRQQVLHEAGREFHFLVTEHVVRHCLGNPSLVTGQVDRLVQLSSLSTVTLAVLSASAAVLPWHNFIIYDSDLVVAELVHGHTELTEPDSVKLYESLWEQLETLAVFDDAARELLARIAEDYRKDAGA